MQCLHCGYFMSPLDKDCTRCRQRGQASSAQTAPPNPVAPNTTPSAQQYAPYGTPPVNGMYAPPIAPNQYQLQYQQQPPQYQQPPYGPYSPPTPAPRPVASKGAKGSHVGELIGGGIGAVVIITVIGLRIYMAMERIARRDAINQSYAAARQNGYNSTPNTVIIGQPTPTLYVNSQPGIQSGFNSGQYAAQQAQDRANQNLQRLQEMQQQSQQRMQDMQQQNQQRMQDMQQNRPGFGGSFGGGFGHRPGF